MTEPTSPARRQPLDVEATAQSAVAHGLVILAGAGVSMGPPASLPGWSAINNAFLEGLGARISLHTGSSIGYDVAEFVASQRDTAATAQPDLQAQLAEESLGHQYFALFTPLDIETWTDAHAALASLATSGYLKAIVTTNFDRLIECALDKAGVPYATYCSPADFERLPATAATVPLPVIKVHGSVERPDTMVDTLQQRVTGRPVALERTLATLFVQHAVLVAGFSGADLAYDPHYLGLRAGAHRSPAFVVINRTGSEPQAAIASLVAESGPSASIVDDTLPDCLVALARALMPTGALPRPDFDVEMEYPGMRRAVLPSAVFETWAKDISPVRATVVLASIARVAGSDDAAARLLGETMPHHLKAGLHRDPALPAQVRMLAERQVELCHLDANLSDGRFPGEPALRLLNIVDVLKTPESVALLSLTQTLLPQFAQADGAALAALEMSRDARSLAARADVVCTLARSWSIAERWEPAHVGLLRDTYAWIGGWGDEPRRARLGALLARALIETGALDDAESIVVDCQGVARRLNLALTGNDLIAVGGRLYLARRRFDKAASALSSACQHYQRSLRNLALAETVLPLAEAAFGLGNTDLASRAFAQFDDVWPLAPGLALGRAATRVRIACAIGAFDDARETVSELASLAEQWGDPVRTPGLCARLTRQIATAERS